MAYLKYITIQRGNVAYGDGQTCQWFLNEKRLKAGCKYQVVIELLEETEVPIEKTIRETVLVAVKRQGVKYPKDASNAVKKKLLTEFITLEALDELEKFSGEIEEWFEDEKQTKEFLYKTSEIKQEPKQICKEAIWFKPFSFQTRDYVINYLKFN